MHARLATRSPSSDSRTGHLLHHGRHLPETTLLSNASRPRRTTAVALQQLLFFLSEKHQLLLHAWALLSNHYHLVIEGSLQAFIRQFHSIAARDRNHADRIECRRVWFQYRDTQLTYERSYLARLKYVNENAVHHSIVLRATNYRWCSARWFEDHAERAFVQSVQRLKIDAVNVPDDFQPETPEM